MRFFSVFIVLLSGMNQAQCQDTLPLIGGGNSAAANLLPGGEAESTALQNHPQVHSARPERYVATELLAVEQLILMLSNRSNQEGASHEALVFLGRTPQRGWEAIGLTDVDELRSHWRSVATRLLAPYTQSKLSDEKKEKIDLAVELSITQFIRLYSNLRSDFMQQPDQKARLELLTSDSRYEQLRQLGRDGIFKDSSLLGKAMHTILAND